MTERTLDDRMSREIRRLQAVLLVFGSLVSAESVSKAADDLPDHLGLRRLAATLAAVAEARETPSVELPLILRPCGENPAAPPAETSDTRRAMLAWVSEYYTNQVLFHDDDVLALRSALEGVPEEQLMRWVADSQLLREQLADERWRATQAWLRDFLAVQAIYSPEQIAELRSQFGSLPPSTLLRVLDHFQLVYASRVRSRLVGEQYRLQQLVVPAGMRAPRTVTAASFSAGGGFPSTVGSGVTPRSGRGPLVVRRPTLSRRLSDYYIDRAIFGDPVYYGWAW